MSMPGFTAGASLHEAGARYQLTADSASITGGQTVVAQRMKLVEWTCECDARTDICVCESGGRIRVLHAVLGEL